MDIVWLDKFSLIDFPWKACCIIFTPWCNLRCKYCHNKEFVLPKLIRNSIKNKIKEEDFFDFLDTRIWLIDWVSICWWEPTLQKWLVEFCKKIKQKWFLVKLDTNWINPWVLSNLLDLKLLDYIAMDIKHDMNKYQEICQVKEANSNYLRSIDIVKNSWIDYEFRTTVVKWYHKKEDIVSMCKSISWAKKYFLQNFKSWDTLLEDFDWESFSKSELLELKWFWEDYLENIWIRD